MLPMTNKAKRNLSFVLFLLSAVIFIVIVFVKRLWTSDSECYMTWLFILSLLCMLFFSGLYRNYTRRAENDKKCGNDA